MGRRLVTMGDVVEAVIAASCSIGFSLEARLSHEIWSPVSTVCREQVGMVLAELRRPLP